MQQCKGSAAKLRCCTGANELVRIRQSAAADAITMATGPGVRSIKCNVLILQVLLNWPAAGSQPQRTAGAAAALVGRYNLLNTTSGANVTKSAKSGPSAAGWCAASANLVILSARYVAKIAL